ncbi:DUF177 domain-containing protein [Myxococcota bacterium]|nr:DUF177 domain-containing protein [Myxococcota bacterium]MBU1430011.1 DUF177 domain-containing protein [Myxococcota bacterium]MBU1899850.1 DUF177 domain-containing protein [Myxococcota bacterium]
MMKPLGLKFRLDELSHAARPFEGTLSAAALKADIAGLLGGLGYYAETDAILEGEAYRSANREVVLSGHFALSVGFQCARCLTRRALRVEEEKRYVLIRRAPQPEGEEEIVLSEALLNEPDEYDFDGEHVDLEGLFREEIILALPMNPTCEDVGEPPCQTRRAEADPLEEIDPRWAPLLEMKKKLSPS